MKPQHGILQIMGHKAYAGYVQEDEIAGVSVIRIDVPAIEEIPAYTMYFGMNAFYAFTPVTEEAALIAARKLRERPVEVYILPLYQEKFLEPGDDYEEDPWQDESDSLSIEDIGDIPF